jgi:hypothetical protein
MSAPHRDSVWEQKGQRYLLETVAALESRSHDILRLLAGAATAATPCGGASRSWSDRQMPAVGQKQPIRQCRFRTWVLYI